MFPGDQTGFASGCKMFISAVKFDILTWVYEDSQVKVKLTLGASIEWTWNKVFGHFWHWLCQQLEEHKQYDCLVGGQQQQFSSKDT